MLKWENDIVSLKTKRAVTGCGCHCGWTFGGVAREGLALALFVALPKNKGYKKKGGDILVGGFDSTHLKNISQTGSFPQVGIKK